MVALVGEWEDMELTILIRCRIEVRGSHADQKRVNPRTVWGSNSSNPVILRCLQRWARLDMVGVVRCTQDSYAGIQCHDFYIRSFRRSWKRCLSKALDYHVACGGA